MALHLLLVLAFLLDLSQAKTDINGNTCTPFPENKGLCDSYYDYIPAYLVCVNASISSNTFEDAQAACRISNANLVKINDPLLNFDIDKFLDETTFYWIGLYSPDADENVIWIMDNSSFQIKHQQTYFTTDHYPSNRNKSKNNCVGKDLTSHADGENKSFQWADCNSQNNYICARPPHNAPSTPNLTIAGIASGPIRVLNGSNFTIQCKAEINTLGSLTLIQWGGKLIEKKFRGTHEQVTYKEETIKDEKSSYCKRVASAEMTLTADWEVEGLQFGCLSYNPPAYYKEVCSEYDPYCTLGETIKLYHDTGDKSDGTAFIVLVIIIVIILLLILLVATVLALLYKYKRRNNVISEDPQSSERQQQHQEPQSSERQQQQEPQSSEQQQQQQEPQSSEQQQQQEPQSSEQQQQQEPQSNYTELQSEAPQTQ